MQPWGQYSPFVPVPSELDASMPEGCRATLGVVLSRHGARYPTRKKLKMYQSLLERIQRSSDSPAPGYELLNRTLLGASSSRLTPLGQLEMVESGIAFYRRYRELARESEVFVRASGSARVVMSAHNFTQSFLGPQGKKQPGGRVDMNVLPEGDGFNNSLDHGRCRAFEDGAGSSEGRRMQKKWMEVWATPVMHKLNRKLGGAKVTLAETVWLMDLCPFLSVVEANQTQSPICGLFTDEEWRGYDYHQSLGKWYGYGQGNRLGPTQGVGYVNELIARLTGRPVQDATSTNATPDASPDTFPLDRRLYADFSHDNTMTAVFAALSLYNQTADLPPTRRLPPHRAHGYSASWTVPFAARMYVDKMRCDGAAHDLVRVLVNDRVVPLRACGADSLGRCSVDAFVASLSFARFNGLWNRC